MSSKPFSLANLPTSIYGFMTSLNYFPFPLSLYLLVYSATPPVQTVSIRSFTYQYIRLHHQYKTVSIRPFTY